MSTPRPGGYSCIVIRTHPTTKQYRAGLDGIAWNKKQQKFECVDQNLGGARKIYRVKKPHNEKGKTE